MAAAAAVASPQTRSRLADFLAAQDLEAPEPHVVTQADIFEATLSKRAPVEACGLLPPGSCAKYGTDVVGRSVEEWENFEAFSNTSAHAPDPEGFEKVPNAIGLKAAVSSSVFLGARYQSDYDTRECAAFCDAHYDCQGFNLYFERDPARVPSPQCPNPSPVTNVVCSIWGCNIEPEDATNVGEWREKFQVLVAGSTSFRRTATEERLCPAFKINWPFDGPQDSDSYSEPSAESEAPIPMSDEPEPKGWQWYRPSIPGLNREGEKGWQWNLPNHGEQESGSPEQSDSPGPAEQATEQSSEQTSEQASAEQSEERLEEIDSDQESARTPVWEHPSHGGRLDNTERQGGIPDTWHRPSWDWSGKDDYPRKGQRPKKVPQQDGSAETKAQRPNKVLRPWEVERPEVERPEAAKQSDDDQYAWKSQDPTDEHRHKEASPESELEAEAPNKAGPKKGRPGPPWLAQRPEEAPLGQFCNKAPRFPGKALEVPWEPVGHYDTLMGGFILFPYPKYSYDPTLCAKACNDKTAFGHGLSGQSAPFVRPAFPQCNEFQTFEVRVKTIDGSPSVPAAMVCGSYTSQWGDMYATFSGNRIGPKQYMVSNVRVFDREGYKYPPICPSQKKCETVWRGGDCSGWGKAGCQQGRATID